ncbi:siderophore ferric iron reductase [Vibrio methylphosphonaticus]|uniref:siderophore ferric iron reductase n=1 Tax=Vibrio methylphosphonaticus TaxID=2946866 RepID=UPI00202A446B|nr:siderophore ferric iron reductase [Vibrio methylphosphonaticus]MCL9775168.1 siderophore ferric iron reductase [Vibrio methylphosphonaticus]
MTHTCNLQTLTNITTQVSPLLRSLPENSCVINPTINTNNHIDTLYQFWKTTHPEAGRIYWLTRAWTMLIWQPVTIALIASYYSDQVPTLSSMIQGLNRQTGVVGNFDFREHQWQSGNQHERQRFVAQELNILLDDLANQFDNVCRISPSTREKLLADTVMEMLLRGLKQMVLTQQLTRENIELAFSHELHHWQQALKLPVKRFGQLNVASDGEFFIQKRVCCMHYRRSDGNYCQGCPQKK